ncbi:MAG: HIT domain-containing protein [Spirochaetales bacterium]|nr:HIT domain-containing protein [Spirochaetales bacterium]
MQGNYFFCFEKLTYFKGKKPDGCILCLLRDSNEQIVDLTIYRSEHFIASVNLYPYNPGHIFIFPTRHIEDIREFTGEEESQLTILTRKLLNVLDKAFSPAAYNIGYNMRPAAGASINHIHRHIIPRYPNEIGIADLIGGNRVLVEDPRVTAKNLRELLNES